MDNEKRMAGDYEVFHALGVGTSEIVLGENPRADEGEKYMCAFCTYMDIFANYTDVMVSDDYVEILQLFGERVMETAEKLQEQLRLPPEKNIDDTPVRSSGFTPVTDADDLNGKVVIIKPEVLKREFERATRQYQLVTGGFGASANSRGTSCFCINIYNGKTGKFQRQDVLGIVAPEQMPDWVKDGLDRAEKQRKHDKGAR